MIRQVFDNAETATGTGKAGMVARLLAGDRAIPAGRVAPDAALLLADRAAGGTLP